ncbi:Hypothetical protein D9617_1g083360 [Elsinoe fawcettii]|nr:Hypothetical protein D9617_1g083360 [Elsinoe fawcettii]
MHLPSLFLLFGLALAAPGPLAEPNAVADTAPAAVGFTDYSEVFTLEKRQVCGSTHPTFYGDMTTD